MIRGASGRATNWRARAVRAGRRLEDNAKRAEEGSSDGGREGRV